MAAFIRYNDQYFSEEQVQYFLSDYEVLKDAFEELRIEHKFLSMLNKIFSQNKVYSQLIKDNRLNLLEFAESNRDLVSYQRFASLMNIKPWLYRDWLKYARILCRYTESPICARPHRGQLNPEEERNILSLLTDPRYLHFPLSSLMWKAQHEGLVYANYNTWMKYKQAYNIPRLKPKRKRKAFYKGLKAERVNQFLHADVTEIKLADKRKFFIYLVMDNYSRLIKAWTVSSKITIDTRIKTFETALRDTNPTQYEKVTFITDNGRENKGPRMRKFLKDHPNVELKIAKIDIRYSDSMVERLNHDLKYRYLYRNILYNKKQLVELMEFAVEEKNRRMRLGCIGGQTPQECYNGVIDIKPLIKERWKRVKMERKEATCCIARKNRRSF